MCSAVEICSGTGFSNDLRDVLSLRGSFETQILPNSQKVWISVQRALDIHFMIIFGRTYSFKIT